MPNIPWTIAVPSEVLTEVCGVSFSAYHGSPEAQMDVQLRGSRILNERYGLPLQTSIYPDFTTYLTGSVFGLGFEVFEDQVPAPRGHPIASIGRASDLTPPADIRRAGLFPQAIEFYEWMVAHAPAGVSVGFSGGSQAPFTTAVLLRGEGFLTDVLDEPEQSHRFLAALTEACVQARELVLWVAESGRPRTAPPQEWRPRADTVHFTDDYGGMLSPGLYGQFDVGYMLEAAARVGATRLSIHSELLRKQHLRMLQEAGWEYIDVGTDPYLSIADCLDVLHVPFLVQMKTSAELLLSTPDEIKGRYREMVAEGATSMLVELCRGVPDANIRAFIEVACEFDTP